MATSAATTTGFIPSRENHYGVVFGDRECSDDDEYSTPEWTLTFPHWTNPYNPLIFVIPPYTFSCDQDLLESCNNVYKQNCQSGKWISDSRALTTLHQDAFNRIFVFLEPKDLVHFSQVSKCCYLATKAGIIWEIQLQKCFPKTKTLPEKICSFSPEQQFKIYFKRMNDEKRPYIAQLERNNEVLLHLGKHGSGGAIDLALKMYGDTGGGFAVDRFCQALQTLRNKQNAKPSEWDALYNSDLGKADRACSRYTGLVNRQKHLAGHTYDGTDQSIVSDSQQGRCKRAIQKISEIFNDQENFEKFIRGAEAAKNNAPQSNEIASLQDPFQPWIDADSGTGDSHPNT
jgi:hypothetical protein